MPSFRNVNDALDEPIVLGLKKLKPDVQLPVYAHPFDAGLDIRAYGSYTIQPFERTLISTGYIIVIPEGYCGLVLPRSGRALKEGLSLPNTPGLIDSNYRGELLISMINLDPHKPIDVSHGQRVAQLLIQKIPQVKIEVIDKVEETSRGERGFGSSGIG